MYDTVTLWIAGGFLAFAILGTIYTSWQDIKGKLPFWQHGIYVWFKKKTSGRTKRLRAREQAMKKDKSLKKFIADVVTSAMEDAVYAGRFTREDAQKTYKQIGLALEIPDFLPFGVQRKNIRALKAELRSLRKRRPKEPNGFKDFDSKVIPLKSGRVQRSILNRKPAA